MSAEARYEGRMESDGFGHVFLPDAEGEDGGVPSLNRWAIDNTVGPEEGAVIQVRQVRITIELTG